MLKIKNLNFSYQKSALLKNINLNLNEGKFIGILGPNGSGKSTLFKLILKNLPLKDGEITVFGKSLNSYSLREFASLVGFVPQKSALNAPLKVIDVLLMSKYLGLKHAFDNYDEKALNEARELANKLKIEDFLERNVLSLSGGEFQRVLLARALLKKPRILFLDEPTSALDLNYALELLGICEDLIKTQKISVVAILHDLNLAAMFCDEILFLKDGKIRYQGEPKELFTREILKEIYNLNCEIIIQNSKPLVVALKNS